MAENTQLSFDIRVGGNQDQALGSLKAQLREATQEVTKLSEQFGATSKEAVNAAKRAAELKDQIGDAKSLIDAFNPDAKFKALTASLSGVAGGFSALQGATALFGKENEDLQKTLLKVNSAMALSQGLQAVGESIDSFKQLGTVIKTQVVSAFSTLRGALIATGIGALAIGIGLVAANFDKVKKAVLNLVPGLAQVGTFFSSIITKVTDFVGVTSQAERALASLEKTTKRGNEGIEARIKVLTAQGGKEKEIYELSKQQGEAELTFLRAKLKTKEGLTDEELKKFRGLKTEQAVLDAQEQKRINDGLKDAAKVSDDANKEAAAKRKAEAEKRKAEEERLSEELLKTQQDRRKLLAEDNLITQDQLAQDKKDAEEKAKKEQEAIDNERLENQKKVLATTTNFTLQGIQEQQNAAKAEAEIERLATENKLKELELQKAGAMAALDAVAGLIDQNSVAGKAIAVAKAVMSTYEGATKALGTYPPPFGQIAAAATIAAGLINVKKIVSTNIPSAKGTGSVGGGATAPSISSAAPITPPQPQAATTNLSNQTINAIGNQAIRSYVVESDVTSNQQRIAAIQQRARFG
jgi:chromosome segregation ATPase